MPLYSLDGVAPSVHPGAFVAPTATLVGNVIVEEGASVWYNVVLRADYSAIHIRAGANVQDNSVLHGPPDSPTDLGEDATVGHGCVVHGAVVGARTIIGNGAVVMDGARIGSGSLVAAHSMVAVNTEIPDGVLVAGSPATVRREIAGTPVEQMLAIQPVAYRELAVRHARGVALVEG
ncbi:gamma carbonic anhydrase family protein [Actinophytocola xinjiangensis]|uniref:Gamma carbonic anhydrase family protein n=1 Tax=Actinophytocola xinjiangensis TaxID=485602 RepID=A0A7Z0WGI5_9PSEU|nr:gamma carbonic anhydrase family protein [Actinophytocola xinjiangensis]OLF06685.1 gamma carbonic anhydrase family protein [Actinophytocola xinjiangensis]